MANKPSQDLDSVGVPSALVTVEYVMHAAHHLRTRGNAQLAEHHTSVPRTRLLTALRGQDPQRMGDVAARLGITGRTMTVMTDALEREGLLERLPDPADRRATLLRLTPAGWDQVCHAYDLREELSEQVLSALSPDERRTLVLLLRKLTGSSPDCC